MSVTMIGAIRKYLLADETISSLVGTSRIYVGSAPSNVVSPYVVITQISGSERSGLNDTDGQDESLYQIDVWGKNYEAMETLRLAIRSRINGKYKIDMSGYTVHSITEEDQNQTTEPESDGSETEWQRSTADYTFVLNNSTTE